MPKKGMNPKVLEAREKKENKKNEAAAKQEKAQEDAYWAAAGDGSKSKAQQKKEEQEKQRQEALAKKAEAKKLADEEMEALSRPKSSKPAQKPMGKVEWVCRSSKGCGSETVLKCCQSNSDRTPSSCSLLQVKVRDEDILFSIAMATSLHPSS